MSAGGAVRGIYLCLGFLFVGTGFVGVIVPGMPTTVFFIMALWAFKKSSPRFEAWLLNHKVFGPTLRDWDENRSIKKRTKIVAISVSWLFLALSLTYLAFQAKYVVFGIVLAVGIWLTWFLASRDTTEEVARPLDKTIIEEPIELAA